MKRLFFIVMFIGVSCSQDDNLATCKDKKPNIAEMTSTTEVEEAEAKEYSSTCTILSYDEDARVLINQAAEATSLSKKIELFAQAAVILEKLVEFYPDEYDRYGVLAAAYAGVAGIEMIDFLLQAMESEGSPLENGQNLVMTPDNDNFSTGKASLAAAVEWLEEKKRLQGLEEDSVTDGQIGVYSLALTMMTSNEILARSTSGTWDQETVENMTAEDVEAILDNMETVAAALPEGQAKEFEEFQNSSELTEEEKKDLIRNAFAGQ